MRDEGHTRFSITKHAELWRQLDAKNPAKGYGTLLAKTWYWYENWVNVVREHCVQNADFYA